MLAHTGIADLLVRLRIRGCSAALAAVGIGALATPAGASTTVTFSYTGAAQQFVVPAGVTSVTVDVLGAQGGDGYSGATGGKGADAHGAISVHPGETLEVMVGGRGGTGGFEHGGFNGGGGASFNSNSVSVSGGGGGASDVRVAPFGLADRLIVGGGGGGGGGYGAAGGPGGSGGPAGGSGGASGAAGTTGGLIAGADGGTGGGAGDASSGGSAGTGGAGSPGGSDGSVGTLGQGGDRGQGASAGGDGGGGGGGYFGGGGGGGGGFNPMNDFGAAGGGGGGGSSFVSLLAGDSVITDSVQSGNGVVTITYPPAGYFSRAGLGPMQHGRLFAAAAPLPSGDVLIAGGADGTAAPISTAEVFDPTTGMFTTTGSMTSPRMGASAAPLPNGDVLVAGGQATMGSNVSLASAELFDPVAGTFTALPHLMTTTRSFAAAALLPDGEVLIAGGVNAGGNLSSAELFDPATGKFRTTGALIAARAGAVAAPLPGGDVLVAGGGLTSGELYDPATNSFTAAQSSMTTPRVWAVASPLPNGKVLIAGGFANGKFLSSAEVFDPQSQTFAALPESLTGLRSGGIAAPLPDGNVLIAGGDDMAIHLLTSPEVFVSAPEAATAGGDFGGQTVGDPSVAQPLTVMNVGAQPLMVSSASLGGTNAGDYAITANGCAGRRLAFEQSCTITVRFTPAAAGARSATLALTDNEPLETSLPLSGTGVAAGSGPGGTQGAQGPVGPPGPAGKQGPAGQIRLVTCTTHTKAVKKHGKTHRVTVHDCTTRLITGTATFKATGSGIKASISRGETVYATGVSVPAGRGRSELLLTDVRALARGRYTLTLTVRHGRRSTIRHVQIRIA